MSKGFRNFFITFVLSLIVFGFIAYKMVPDAVKFFLPDESGSESATSEVSGDTSDVTSIPPTESQPSENIKGTTFTTLLLGKDMYGNIDAAMLLKVNKETKTYLIISIPTDMQLQIDGVNQKLKTLLNSRDIAFFSDKIYAITGLRINYYAIFDVNGLIRAVDSLGTNLSYNIPRDMRYEDPDQGLVIDLKKGTTKLTGEIVSHILRFVPPSGEQGRLAQQRDIMQSILVQLLTLENISKAPAMVETIIENAETNFTLQAFNNNTELIFRYSSFTKQIVQYPGTMNKIGEVTYFEPDIAAAISLFQQQK